MCWNENQSMILLGDKFVPKEFPQKRKMNVHCILQLLKKNESYNII